MPPARRAAPALASGLGLVVVRHLSERATAAATAAAAAATAAAPSCQHPASMTTARRRPLPRHPLPHHPRPFSTTHWLDRYPAASDWLARKARDLWMRGLRERCGSHPALAGREDLVVEAVRRRAADLEADALAGLAGAAGGSEGGREGLDLLDAQLGTSTSSSRARTHAQAAALGAATVAVLRPLVRDDAFVAAALADFWGGLASPGAARLLAAVAALTPDPYPSAARRLASLAADWGGAAPGARLAGGPTSTSTTLTLPAPCLYAAALDAVGAGGSDLPFLAVGCCSADGAWLAAGCGKSGKARYARTAWAGDGDEACVLAVWRGEGG